MSVVFPAFAVVARAACGRFNVRQSDCFWQISRTRVSRVRGLVSTQRVKLRGIGLDSESQVTRGSFSTRRVKLLGDRSRLRESSYGGIGLDSESQVTGGVVDLFFKTSTRSHEKSLEAVRLWRSLGFSRENTDGLRLL